MNHWFLCARDVMWAALAVAPLVLASAVTQMPSESDLDHGGRAFLTLLALGIQIGGIACLYYGVIQ